MTGLFATLAATTMFFAALTSAYVVRRGISGDWVALPLPPVVYASVLPCVAASLALEAACRNGSRGFLFGGASLGALCGATLGYVWHQLDPSSGPAAAFFYVLSGAFVVYIAGGVLALLYLGLQRVRPAPAIKVTAAYWHYLSALWTCLLVFFYFWP